MKETTLTDAQREVLVYLDGCEHATTNTFRRVWIGRGRGYPGSTLAALKRKGYVTYEHSRTPMSRNGRWTITDAGRQAAAEPTTA